jgi:hypothetical protein
VIRPVGLSASQDCPDDSGVFGSHGDAGFIEASAYDELGDPLINSSWSIGGVHEDRTRAVHEECPKVLIALFGDAPHFDMPARGKLLRDEAKPGGELANVFEVCGVADGGDHGAGGDHTDPEDFVHTLHRFAQANLSGDSSI